MVNKIVHALAKKKVSVGGAKILILGISYKKDIGDIRHSAAIKILAMLKEMDAKISYHDPLIPEIANLPPYPQLKMKSIRLIYPKLEKYDAVIIVTDHSSYDWKKILEHSSLIIDTCNVMDGLPGAQTKVIKA